LVDFSERTDTQKVPAFAANQATPKSSTPNADFGGIKLNLNEPK
jgi:hypothetical protein